MSLAGRIQFRGSTMTVYRPQYGENADRSRKVDSYPVVKTGVRVLLEGISDELVQKVFGGSQTVKERGYVMLTEDVRPDDRILVTAGRRSGIRFLVEDARPNDSGTQNAHLELALASTTEVFP